MSINKKGATMSADSSQISRLPHAVRWVGRSTTIAGLGFSLSWIIGLCVFADSTTVVSTGAEVIASYRGQALAALAQFLFTEGLPPIAILVVVRALCRSMRTSGHSRLARATWIMAPAACIISFAQFVLGVTLVIGAVPSNDAAASAGLSDAVTRLDGVKMLFFGGMAVATVVYLIIAQRVRPIWLSVTSALLAVAIVISGLGYLFALTPLAAAAYASLPLLLVWMTGWGVLLGLRVR
ncbi:hypothetical protein [Humibacter ginsengisoli]